MNYKVSCCPVSCVISCFVHGIKLDETMDLFSEKKKTNNKMGNDIEI